jgi:FkbM family methyltransferase
MKKTLKKTIEIVNKILRHKKIFYYSPNEHNSFGRTAVKTKFGFWYVGDVLDQKDTACGVLNFGLIEPDETRLVLKIYEYLNREKESPVIFDVGANLGYYGLLAANYYKDRASVYCFEPVTTYAHCIEEAIKMNNFNKNIHVCTFALSDSDGSSTIHIAGTCSSLEEDFNEKGLPSQTVELKKLDTFSQDINPDFMKIDVEGHELAMLKGSIETLKRATPVVFIEIIERLKTHNFVNKNYKETISLLTAIGYDMYLFKEGKLKKTETLEEIDGIFMYLFVNPTKHSKLIKNIVG